MSICLLALLAGCLSPSPHSDISPGDATWPGQAPAARHAQLPLYFVANHGQADQDVAYYAHGSRHSITFAEDGVAFGRELRMRFVGATPRQPLGIEPTPARINYLTGRQPAGWHTDLPTYGQLLYAGVYPGIDARFSGEEGALKYTLAVGPGADLGQVRLAFEGAEGLRIDPSGDVLVLTPGGELRDAAPSACQELNGQCAAVEVAFALYDDPAGPQLGFEIRGEYERSRPLIVDPTLFYASYLGGSQTDRGRAIALDAEGYVYVTGESNSGDFPTRNPFQTEQPYTDVFVAKLAPAQGGAASLVYATYLGGDSEDVGCGIAVDAAGNAYVTGHTYSTDFPTTPNGYQPEPYGDFPITGFPRVFVARLNAAGSALDYSTYLRGSGGVEGEWITSEKGWDIATCGVGVVCVTGETLSPDFPTTPNAFQKLKAGDDSTWDAFLTRLDTTQSGAASLLYSTYFGGAQTERGLGIAVDEAGRMYVAGQTFSSPDLPVRNPYQAAPGGDWDGFVASFDAAGALLYSTYLGGSQKDWLHDVAVQSGHAYVAGLTESTDMPTRNPYQAAYQGKQDAFVAKIDAAQSGEASLVYATYLGGEGDECSYSGCYIAVDGQGQAFVAGSTTSAYFPTKNSYRDDSLWDDAFVTQFNAAGNDVMYSTYLGGNGSDGVTGIAVDGQGRAHVVGMTSSDEVFDMRHPYQAQNAGGVDAFVVVLGPDVPDLSTSSKRVDPAVIVAAGAPTYTLSYTISLANTGYLTSAARLTDALPAGLALSAAPACSAGQCAYVSSGHLITWAGSVAPGAGVVIAYAGQISLPAGTAALAYPNVAWLDDGVNPPMRLTATSIVNPHYVYLPLVVRNDPAWLRAHSR
ncbi:MAG: SBBP repeat-containing protein [Thermoflexales bacterium]|nr:SBBP repeat-containing protein [Thermoflexales bacterium]